MKSKKIMLTTIVVLAIIGGNLASKSSSSLNPVTYCITDPNNGLNGCTVSFNGTFDPNCPLVSYTITSNPCPSIDGPCEETPTNLCADEQ